MPDLSPAVPHSAVLDALAQRDDLVSTDASAGVLAQMDEMWACIRDIWARSGIEPDASLRIGLVGLLHILTVRASIHEELGILPDGATAQLAQIVAETAVVLVNDLSADDAVAALTIVTTDDYVALT